MRSPFKSYFLPSFSLRNLLWLYLFYHGYLHFREFLSLGEVVILWAVSLGLGFLSSWVSARFFPTR